MMAGSLVKDVLQFGKFIYELSRKVKGNYEQCQVLADRIQLITRTLEKVESQYEDKKYLKGLNALHNCLKKCEKFIEKFSNQFNLINVVLAGLNQDDFSGLNAELNECVQQLQLEIQLNDAINSDQHRKAQEEDLKVLKEQQGDMIGLLVAGLERQHVHAADRNNFEWLMLQQMVRIQVALSQQPAQSGSAPSPGVHETITTDKLYERGCDKEAAGDFSGAYQDYLTAAKLNHAGAQCNLGVLYFTNKGVPPDNLNAQQGYYWLAEAAKQNHLRAQYNLAVAFEKGKGGMPIDLSRAVYWFKQASLHTPDDKTRAYVESAKSKCEFYRHIQVPTLTAVNGDDTADLILKSFKGGFPDAPTAGFPSIPA